MSISLLNKLSIPFPWHQTRWKSLYYLAKENQLPHALLFSGPSGLGKTQFVKAFSQILLCLRPQWNNEISNYQHCDQCQSCAWFKASSHPNYYAIKPSGSGAHPRILIEQIRSLINALQQTAQQTPSNLQTPITTIAVIHPADTLHPGAANALLKTLEEPLPGILFILVSDHLQDVLNTIQSRCQRIMLPLPSNDEIYQWVQSQIKNSAIEIEDATVKTTLHLSHYLPILTLENLEKKDKLELYTTIFQSLIQLKHKTVNPNEIAQQWLKYSPEMVLESLIYMITYLIKYQLGAIHREIIASNLEKRDISFLVEKIDNQSLFNYLDQIQRARQEIMIHSLNPLLTLEKIAYQFLMLAS